MDRANAVELKNVSVELAGKTILKNLNLNIEKNSRVCIYGSSGSGKTTLSRVIMGLCKPVSGTVDTSFERMTAVFQNDRLLLHRNAVDNIRAVGVDRQTAEKYLKAVFLEPDMKKRPAQLSGGMRRRVALARALAYGGDLYVLDEPLTGLDRQTALAMLELIKKETEGKTLIMFTHDREAAEVLGAVSFSLPERKRHKDSENGNE